MKVSLNWIKDYVDLSGIDEDELVKRFNLSTAEIEKVEKKGADISGVVFGKVVSVDSHPDNPHWHVLSVNIGTKNLQIVCAAPNVHSGMVTCVATDGGMVCGRKITVAARGSVQSEGMCCSADDLGIGGDDKGILDLVGEYPIGADIKSVWPVDDIILEIDNKTLTNRPDLWGHYGMAREFSVIFDRPLKTMPLADLAKFDKLPKIDISVESKNCYRYSAITAENIKVKQSPDYIKIRLTYCGMRDINLLADLTNYIMMDLGLPMHAFDGDIVKGITVLDALDGQKMLTLEGEEHKLPKGAVVIADSSRNAVAIAGIKGGLKSGIADTTSRVLFEAAVFDATAIRKTSRGIGLVTDSSIRYEKSLDPELTKSALARMIYLLNSIDSGAKVTSSFSDCYNKRYDKITINLDPKFISRVIGAEISTEKITKILTGLEFEVTENGGNMVVSVPSFRATKDISIKEDLVEEVARIYGYDNIVPRPLSFVATPITLSRSVEMEYLAKKYLAEKYGATEIHSYVWNYENFNSRHNINSPSYLKLMDSSNSGSEGLRSSLVPTLLKTFEENRNAVSEIKIFEIGRVWVGKDENNLAIEQKRLAVVLASQSKTEEELFYLLKKMIVDTSLTVLGLEVDLKKGECDSWYHPVNNARVASRTADYGCMGIIHPVVVKGIDKRFKVAALEVDFGALCATPTYYKKPKAVSKYQQVEMDFAFLAPKDMPYSQFESLLGKFRNKISNGFTLVDIYEDKSLGNYKSITVRYELGAYDHTLTSEELEKFRADLISHASRSSLILR